MHAALCTFGPAAAVQTCGSKRVPEGRSRPQHPTSILEHFTALHQVTPLGPSHRDLALQRGLHTAGIVSLQNPRSVNFC